MAAKGGGAWKVAYADFVTAMMAFFLVMWLCAQDQAVKETVADYFLDPFGASKLGLSNQPNKMGTVANPMQAGPLPQGEGLASGRGRTAYTTPDDTSRATKWISDWVQTDPRVRAHWRQEANRQRDLAYKGKSTGIRVRTAEEAATEKLADQLRDEFVRGIPAGNEGIYRDLLADVIGRINWKEIAQDLLED